MPSPPSEARYPHRKHPLSPPKRPMTSTSYSEKPFSSLAKGMMEFGFDTREPAERKVVRFNPLLTPSPFLDPKVLEEKRKGAAASKP
ncbi:uncharacterized protein EI97DRAFT_456363 [Westerdykella ornata]|uniref:Uncharacterized protein n=1 Tax=Westerdykella ornata TaxID=318751 RepID=A0A6A6JQM7_WESOR|nr:uncharacterized protein EI97DRAFT_456363 [Westerdykella ornata]KAF2278931.1 hypothetical protein EI97DRAFT_456363 [Westerdykella ornata]